MNQPTLRIVIADDENLSRELLVELLSELPNTEVVGVACQGIEALELSASHQPDLILLDIQMPKLDGLEVAKKLSAEIAVVFVTAYDEYAVRAFERDAVDYLMKPYSTARLSQALERVRTRKLSFAAAVQENAASTHDSKIAEHDSASWRIAVKDGNDWHVIEACDLEWAQAEGDYVKLVSRGREILKHQSMQSLEDSLDEKQFLRIHRSVLVNIDQVMHVQAETRDRFWVSLKCGTVVQASRAGEKKLRERLGIRPT